MWDTEKMAERARWVRVLGAANTRTVRVADYAANAPAHPELIRTAYVLAASGAEYAKVVLDRARGPGARGNCT